LFHRSIDAVNRLVKDLDPLPSLFELRAFDALHARNVGVKSVLNDLRSTGGGGSMSKQGDDVFDDAFRQGRDRQEGIHFYYRPDDRSACDVSSVVRRLCIAKQFAEMLRYAAASVFAQGTTTYTHEPILHP
jgi:hypothetical protein